MNNESKTRKLIDEVTAPSNLIPTEKFSVPLSVNFTVVVEAVPGIHRPLPIQFEAYTAAVDQLQRLLDRVVASAPAGQLSFEIDLESIDPERIRNSEPIDQG